MPITDRVTISLDTELLAAFDAYMSARRYDNRSEAIRDLIRDALSADDTNATGGDVMAVLTAICDAGVSDAASRLRALLADARDTVRTNLHFPLDPRRAAIVVVLRGPVADVRRLTEEVQAMRGITHGKTILLPLAPAPRPSPLPRTRRV